jgi:ketosteroid isomerase-like protein
MAAHPNVETMRRGYTAFLAGDMETVSALLDDGITWHIGGNSPLTGDFVGKQDVFAHFMRLGELTKGSLGFDIHTILADDEHAAVLVDSTLEQPAPYRGREVHIWHLRDGLATEFWSFPQDPAAADAALNA